MHHLALSAVLLAGAAHAQLPSSHEASDKGVYGTDDRTDESRATTCVGETCEGSLSDALRSVGSGSTVALVPRRKLRYDADTNSWIPTSASTLGSGHNLCETDLTTGEATRFAEQPIPASCSGTIVQWDSDTGTGLVASAGHCFDEDAGTNGCQTAAGGLHALPPRTTPCRFENDGECDDGIDGGTPFCPVGTEAQDCPARAVEADTCPFLFVFDFTDATLAPPPPPPPDGPPPPPEACDYPNDGACDSQPDASGNVYCPADSDSCDCLGTHCPAPSPPPFSIPAANVYDCGEVVMCDLEHLANSADAPADWLVDGADSHFTDYALTRIVAAGISSVPDVCSWESDGACDVPTYCPAGTDTVDCGTEDTPELRAARTTDYSHLTRSLLDAGAPRTILPAPLFSGVLEAGTPLTVIGHPSGLPRKYTGGATVQHVAECQLETVCPISPSYSWGAYVADLDTFAGNSGSGTFTSDGRMVGILISGATDFVHRIGDWGGEAGAACKEFARCGAGLNDPPSHCRVFDTSVALPAECVADSDSSECVYTACTGTGLETQDCSGENVASVAAIIAWLEANLPADQAGVTYRIVSDEIPEEDQPQHTSPATPADADPGAGADADTDAADDAVVVTATLTLAGDLVEVTGVEGSEEVRKNKERSQIFVCGFFLDTDHLPRHARDKHKEES
jgi:hypothetical protein